MEPAASGRTLLGDGSDGGTTVAEADGGLGNTASVILHDGRPAVGPAVPAGADIVIITTGDDGATT